MKKWLIAIVLILLVAGGLVGWYTWRQYKMNQFIETARAALATNDFQSARVYAAKAIKITPSDSVALLLFAEAVFKDETVPAAKRVQQALEALEKIPDQASEGLEARTHEASIYFFDQLKPAQAEASLRRAIAINTDHKQSYFSLMQIYCCTSRETFTAPLFESMIQLAESKAEVIEVLTNWFVSQFAIGSFNRQIDQRLRVDSLYELKIPTSQKRLLAFRDASPDDQLAQVALAYWFYLRTDGKQAKVLLEELDLEQLDPSDPLYLMTAVNVYLEVGEIELAAKLHSYWKDQTYFEYWRQKGVLEQDYQNNPAEAAESFERALTIWPGAIDPSVYFRLETCYKLIKDPQSAEKFRQLGEELRNRVSTEGIKELQQILIEQDFSQENCDRFAAFYAKLGRQIEAQYWKNLPSQLE